MTVLRPWFAALLVAVAVAGTVVAPAVHWATHGTHGPTERTTDEPSAAPAGDDAHGGECPDCAHLTTTHTVAPNAEPFYAPVVGLARSLPPADAPATTSNVATPEGRGPPVA